MSVDPNAGGTGTPVDQYIRVAKQYWESARSAYRDITGAEPSKREREVLREAGYEYKEGTGKRPFDRGWFDPNGRRISEDAAAAAADRIKRAQDAEWDKRAAKIGERSPTYKRRQRERLEAELGKIPDAEPPRTPTRRPTKTPDTPRAPGRVGRIIDAAVAVAAGTGILDVLRGVYEEVGDRSPPPPTDPGMGSPGQDDFPGRPGPFVPSVPPVILPPLPAPTSSAPPSPKSPAPVDRSQWEPLLLPVPVYSTPIPAPPSAPTAAPGGAPTPTVSTPPPVPAYQQALPWLVGAAVPLLSSLTGAGSSRLRQLGPLTVPQPGALSFLSAASQPLPFPGSGFSSGSSSKDCECKTPARKKAGKRKKRSVCYAGTYIERANGLTKTKRRKVQCR